MTVEENLQESECSCHSDECHAGGTEKENRKGKIVLLTIGAAVFAAGLVLEHLFDVETYIPAIVFFASYIMLGGEVLIRAVKNILKGRIFDENFLMGVATIGALAIGEFPEAVAVMLFYQVGEFCQEAAVYKSRRSIASLMDIRPDYAIAVRDGGETRVAPDEVGVGEHILVRPGEKIPLDGVVVEGGGSLDTKSLTGESLPRDVTAGDAVHSGCVNLSGLLRIEVSKPYGESTAAKILDLVENAGGKKAPTENFITRFSRFYTPAVVGLAALLAIVPPLVTGGGWAGWIHRGLVFLVISCPCALVISIPLGFFGGIGGASRKGILVKGGNYLEALGNLDVVVFDKTGTLTKGVFEVTRIFAANGFSEAEVLEVAAHAESFSNHPIARSICGAFEGFIDKDLIKGIIETPGRGVEASIGGRKVLAGNSRFMDEESIPVVDIGDIGTKAHIAVDGDYAGCIVISDVVKPDARDAVINLRAKGVRKTVMLTGDDAIIAERIAADLSIDEVYSELLPHEKVGALESIINARGADPGLFDEPSGHRKPGRKKSKLAYVGDGINDAPVLARSDIGIAMGGLGSDAAIEAADVVLMTDEPSKLIEAIDTARATRRIVWQNIIFALGVKGAILALGVLGLASMWAAVFADVGVALLAVLNATRVMRR